MNMRAIFSIYLKGGFIRLILRYFELQEGLIVLVYFTNFPISLVPRSWLTHNINGIKSATSVFLSLYNI